MADFLVVIDAQNDFIEGNLGTKEAQQVVPKIVQRIQQSQSEIILFTKDTHYTDYLQTSEGINLPIEHCIINTEGWHINKEIRRAWKNNTNTIVLNSNANRGLDINNTIQKPTFGSIALMGVYSQLMSPNGGKDDTVELCGFCTDVCVITNALMAKSLLPEANIIVNSQLCAGTTPEKHEMALEIMKACQIKVV